MQCSSGRDSHRSVTRIIAAHLDYVGYPCFCARKKANA